MKVELETLLLIGSTTDPIMFALYLENDWIVTSFAETYTVANVNHQ